MSSDQWQRSFIVYAGVCSVLCRGSWSSPPCPVCVDSSCLLTTLCWGVTQGTGDSYGITTRYVVEIYQWHSIKSLRQNSRHFPGDIFKSNFTKENVWISIKFSLKVVPKGPVNNTPALVQIIAWRRPGDKPLSEPMMVILLTHICVDRPQWVKTVSWEMSWCKLNWQ